MSDSDEFERIKAPSLDKSGVEKLIGTKVADLSLYQKAFTHKSALKRYILEDSFETLEFIGDSVLGFIITKFLFDKFEDRQEGFLTKARTKLVRGETLASIARKLNLDNFVIMDEKGERNGWNRNLKVLEDVFEALIGAIYMDLGLLYAKRFVLDIFENSDYIDLDMIHKDDNYKDQLMRYCQAKHVELPEYLIESHINGVFKVTVTVENAVIGIGDARNKRQAEQKAALMGLKELCII